MLLDEGKPLPNYRIAEEAGYPELAGEVDALIVKVDIRSSRLLKDGEITPGLFALTYRDKVDRLKGERYR